MRWSQKIGKPVKLRRYIDHADDIRFVRRFNAVLKGGGNFAVFFRRPESTNKYLDIDQPRFFVPG